MIRSMSGSMVERRQHEVEPFEHPIRKIEAPIGQDVDFAAVQDCDVRKPLAQGRRRLDVETGPDLDLQPAIAQFDSVVGEPQHVVERLTANADADRKRAPVAAPKAPERRVRFLR